MKKIINIIYVIGCISVIFSCSDFLDIDVPKDQVDTNVVFNDDKTAVAAMNSVYIGLLNDGFLGGNINSNIFLMSCYTDELIVTTSQDIDIKYFYELNIQADNIAIRQLWNSTYQQIYKVNSILEGLNNSVGLSDEMKKQVRGEALAVRGLLHFYLTQTFGNVPYVTSIDYNINKRIGKLDSAIIMQNVINDLLEAEELLKPLNITSERIKINRNVVEGFLARMYLYQENWSLAQEYAERLINNPNYQLETLENTFLKDSRSAIWQLKPLMNGFNTYDAMFHVFSFVPAPFVKLNLELVNAFELDDQRKLNWIKSVGSSNENFHAYKYKSVGSTSPSKEYSMILRIEEMYLIAAEATAELQNWSISNNYINNLRQRANLPNVNYQSINEATNKILQERKVEFFCELGHRFYDLKRKNHLEDLTVNKPNWQPHLNVLPIPQTELILNPNLLPQNTGY